MDFRLNPTQGDLRDYFAAHALQGLLSNARLYKQINDQEWVEKLAWSIADKMLKLRG